MTKPLRCTPRASSLLARRSKLILIASALAAACGARASRRPVSRSRRQRRGPRRRSSAGLRCSWSSRACSARRSPVSSCSRSSWPSWRAARSCPATTMRSRSSAVAKPACAASAGHDEAGVYRVIAGVLRAALASSVLLALIAYAFAAPLARLFPAQPDLATAIRYAALALPFIAFGQALPPRPRSACAWSTRSACGASASRPRCCWRRSGSITRGGGLRGADGGVSGRARRARGRSPAGRSRACSTCARTLAHGARASACRPAPLRDPAEPEPDLQPLPVARRRDRARHARLPQRDDRVLRDRIADRGVPARNPHGVQLGAGAGGRALPRRARSRRARAPAGARQPLDDHADRADHGAGRDLAQAHPARRRPELHATTAAFSRCCWCRR